MSSSPIRCRGTWKIHKRTSEPDRWLDEMGFFRKHIARDASCLFRVVSENIFSTQRYHPKVRVDCAKFISSNNHLFEGSMNCPIEKYVKEILNPSEWGGLIEISALSHLYRRDFVIFEATKGPQTKICNGYGDTIFLFYSPDTKHFDAVYTKEFISVSSFCQSVVYEILYDGVYQLKDLSYAVEKMLHDKVPGNHIEYFMSENVERRKKQKERAKALLETGIEETKENTKTLAVKCKHNIDDIERASLLKESLSIFVFNRSLIQLENACLNCLNVNSAKDLLDHGITPFPYKVAKALDPNIYRNIEFDVWSEMRRELRYGARYSDGTTLQVGVKCLCKLSPDQTAPYHCHIQEMRPDGGPCLVFIEELGEKRVVGYDQLEALPIEEVRPWAPPYRYSRANSQFLSLSQMLQQLGSITRKQGLGKARKGKNAVDERSKSPEKSSNTTPIPTLPWKDQLEETDPTFHTHPYATHNMSFSAYQHLDVMNFEPIPVEIEALPLMVDCRPAGGLELPHNGTSEHHAPPLHRPMPPVANATAGAAGEMANTNASNGRASTPATAPINNFVPPPPIPNPLPPPLTVGTPNTPNPMGTLTTVAPMSYCAPYCGVKSVMWCGSHPPPPPPPPHVNPNVYKSVHANGADLPINDISTLRYYFNLGVECMWASYGPPPPPRHYSPRDLAQEMQQVSLYDRPMMNHNGPEQNHKHKPMGQQGPDKGGNNQNKGNGQRPLLGPRFKRNGNNQDGNQNSNHNNKGHNNNMNNKGPNNRRDNGRYTGGPTSLSGSETGDHVVSVPYVYPPPVYHVPYYPVEDPAMMGMMSGMGYMPYEEMEYGAPVQFLPPPYPPPHPPQMPHHHLEHK